MNAPAASTNAGKFMKKISPAEVCPLLTPPVDLKTLGDVRPVPPRTLYYLFCKINRTKEGHTHLGAWVRFMGDFRVIDPATGEQIGYGPAAHIPGVMTDVIYTKLDEVKSNDPRAFVEVALEVKIVTAKPGKPSATGYEYDVQPLLEMKTAADDPLALMIAEVKRKQLQLSAPTTENSTTVDVTPAKGKK